MNIIIIAITLIYIVLIGSFIVGFFNIKEFNRKGLVPQNSFTVIIPFRNEAQNLPDLLESLALLKYPKEMFEIVLINDESEDDFEPIIKAFKIANKDLNLSIINSKKKSNSPKKDAIETGISFSRFDWILTTDADCVLPNYWINSFDEMIQVKNSKFIAGQVTFKTSRSFLDIFQLIDFSALVGCTIGGFGIKKPFLCNGANLCYEKKAFIAVDGFNGNKNIASGDDIFLLEKMTSKYPNNIHFIKSKDNTVKTSTMKTLIDLISQRIRWASKTTAYTNKFALGVSYSVFFMNLLFGTSLIYMLIFGNLDSVFLIPVLLKLGVDFIIILLTLKSLKKSKAILYYPIISLIHPFFNIGIGCITLLKKRYSWKNRNF